ncbi:MAG: alkaline phosphatase family protein, partial [Flavobacteriaceae bacterium]
IETYTASGPDDTPYEGIYKGADRPTFPYDLSTLSPDYYKDKGLDIVRNTPFGNTLVTDMALLALAHEDLGKDDQTDVLMISYSSTDHVGHQFGLTAIETQDTYLRLDLELERLFSEIDQMVGMDDVTLFLTSDHGAVHVPKYLNDHNFPGGHDKSKGIKDQVNQVLFSKTGIDNLVLHIGNDQMYLDHEQIEKNRLHLDELAEEAIRVILRFSTIEKAFKTVDVPQLSPSEKLHNLLLRGNHIKRAGDVYMIPKPGHIDYGHTGTTHGTGFSYDTHAPLLMMGRGIKAGHTFEETSITDIAPTMCALLGTAFPNGMTGNVISKALLKADK